jgi:hypothetical protein
MKVAPAPKAEGMLDRAREERHSVEAAWLAHSGFRGRCGTPRRTAESENTHASQWTDRVHDEMHRLKL